MNRLTNTGFTSKVIAWVVLCTGLLSSSLSAKNAAADRPLLHPLFTDHMVLQREVVASVWGWASPG